MSFFPSPPKQDSSLNNLKVVKYMNERREFGSFYYRFPEGESGADVYDRVTDFLGSLNREFKVRAQNTTSLSLILIAYM